ncbi:hypothetical protein QEH52_19565 [Coraliomargarita sp. SDUM461003]|uniref:GIY-YIG domain-containing protein n=1 Tax=Thalassobacterium maritimum TaxID=3041265 RepID=A0ABU1B004_9BACT|nr:hypothetical protein [Coraliomargarita sp. SDUM461003]MDQ8209726.1 hypothetical protein [Coraliomargarita sp. SDUM461003]
MNPKKTKWLIGCSASSNPDLTYYQEGNGLHWIAVQKGVGPHSSGASYSSLIEWKGRKESILRHLKTTECDWFTSYLEKGIKEESFSESEVLDEFRKKNGFEPIDCSADTSPHHTFNQQRAKSSR